jgi:NADPH-dependent ferric siderophore reductase
MEASAEWKAAATRSSRRALTLREINTTARRLQVDIAQPPERGGFRR